MDTKDRVQKIMTTELVQLNISDDLYKAERLFSKHKIRHIPVLDGKKIVGILSLTDLMRISYADVIDEDDDTVESVVYNMFRLSQVMTRVPETVSSESTIKEAASILASRNFHALPVVDNDELVGIVTTTDVIRYYLNEAY
ncbi:CBS domain-containing protein [Robertkochia marina]|uniref:CBS domain-containing protein n=1 Tax=Robertkochia marina TaxID=1227945 RepID=A0A4S3M3Y6_9FLAO|nr:CBS domain-containing protein [Robertkochia marina]THD69856.1 CBS domain-containing protein [Robertkochia marina]TRZ46799.1 CBS domain-containing protein [Robertkochia marina]